MASVQHLYGQAYKIPFKIINYYKSCETDLRKRFFAAVLIQALWRGHMVRKKMELWKKAAMLIQRVVRGWLVRWHMPDYYRAYILRRQRKYYNEKATKIQSLWRGYWIRKKMCVKERVAEKLRLERINEELQRKMKEEFEKMKSMSEKEEESKKMVLFTLFKIHHLLRTEQREGVYSIHNSSELSIIEKAMKAVPMKNYMKELRAKYYEKCKHSEIDLQPLDIKNIAVREFAQMCRGRNKNYDIKQTIKIEEKSSQNKPFILNSKIEPKPYEPVVVVREDNEREEYDIMARVTDPTKHISKHDFDLFVHKFAKVTPKWPPYHIDWQEKQCPLHTLQSLFNN